MFQFKKRQKVFGSNNMAEMHPNDIAKKKHVYSEEKFFNALREQLGPKYHVFFSVRWYTEDESGNREDSECDFLVFNPDYGYLCIEVKGGRGIYVDENDDWFLVEDEGDRKLKKSPYYQAEQSMRFFKKYYEDELQTRFPGIYGSAVAFPNFNVSSPITVESPLELTIDLKDMNNLKQRITEIFRYYSVNASGVTSFMSPEAQKKFINLINKRVALSIAAGALIEDKRRELEEINQVQDVIIDFLANYPRAFIVGGAGTGKTWIGIKKLRRGLASGKRVLYLCNNPILVNEVKEIVNNDSADVFTVEQLARKALGDRIEEAPCVNGCNEYSDLVDKECLVEKYDLIVVDEAQDFTEDWAFFTNMFLTESGSLYVFYDENQNVYSRNFGDKFFISNEPFILRYNIRNTSNIYQYTKERTHMGLDTMSNQIEGVEPDVRQFSKKQQIISFLDSTVTKLVTKEGISPNNITILSNRQIKDSVFACVESIGGYNISTGINIPAESIRCISVEDFKGLESDIIIYINHTFESEIPAPEVRAIQYTAMTRARFYLYVIDYILKGY